MVEAWRRSPPHVWEAARPLIDELLDVARLRGVAREPRFIASGEDKARRTTIRWLLPADARRRQAVRAATGLSFGISWAVEGCNGIGRHVAQRLVADGETVVDVPAKLAARARLGDTGNGRKTDSADAHSVAVVALRTRSLMQVRVDDELVALRLLADRRDELGRSRTQTVSRLHRLLLELVPGGAKRFPTAAQAQVLLDSDAPTDVAGRVRHQLATELLGEIVVLDKKMNDSDKTLRKAVTAPATGASTECCTSWPSCRSASTPLAAPTSADASPRARRQWRRCGLSDDDCPMWCIDSSLPTQARRAREDT